MLKLTRRHRDQYLLDLASEPLFRDVPKHLLPMVGRLVDIVRLRPGSRASCDPIRETMILADGHAVLEDSEHRPIAIIGPGRAIASPFGPEASLRNITAISSVRCVVIGRREIRALLEIAPGVARALDVVLQVPAYESRPEIIPDVTISPLQQSAFGNLGAHLS